MSPRSSLTMYCRTCFIKLGETNYCIDSPQFVSINKFPIIEDLMRKCLGTSMEVLLEKMSYLCTSCLEKWNEFENLCRMTISSLQKFRKILLEEEAPDGNYKVR